MVNVHGSRDSPVSFSYSWDYRQIKNALRRMDRESNKLLSNAISGVLRKEMENTRRRLKTGSRGMSGSMQDIVADSLIVEEGLDRSGWASVRFGADPIDEGGPAGGRATGDVAWFAQMLETGIPSFEYAFKAMKINQGSSMQSYEGWINTGKNALFPGIKPVSWLKDTMKRARPQIADAIVDTLNKAWGRGQV
jgi:hypothetical protein